MTITQDTFKQGLEAQDHVEEISSTITHVQFWSDPSTKVITFHVVRHDSGEWFMTIESVRGVPGRGYEDILRTHARASKWIDALIALGVKTI